MKVCGRKSSGFTGILLVKCGLGWGWLKLLTFHKKFHIFILYRIHMKAILIIIFLYCSFSLVLVVHRVEAFPLSHVQHFQWTRNVQAYLDE